MDKNILFIPCNHVSLEEKKHSGKPTLEPLFHCSLPGYVSISSKDTVQINTLDTASYQWDSVFEKIQHAIMDTTGKTVLLFGARNRLEEIVLRIKNHVPEAYVDISLAEKNHAGLVNYYCRGRFFTLELSPRNISVY